MRNDLWVGELSGVQELDRSKKRPHSAIPSHRKREKCDRVTYSLKGTQKHNYFERKVR